MSGTALRAIGGWTAGSAVMLALAAHPVTRRSMTRFAQSSKTTYALSLVAAIVAYLNLKNIPGMWHVRVLRAIIYQLYFQPHHPSPQDLFKPMTTKSFNTLYDCDYNIHKSNSTYFADLDVGRAHLVAGLVRTGMARLNKGDELGLSQQTIDAKGQYTLALGGVACFFGREIAPLAKFDVHTRLLAWDRKWMYTISHITRRGAVKPEAFVLQPGKRGRGSRKVRTGGGLTSMQMSDPAWVKANIHASSIAKYVFKKGRLTINPEIVLQRSYLLPPRPDGVSLPPRAEVEFGKALSVVEEGSTPPLYTDDEVWTWDMMERERMRGLRIAYHFDQLDQLNSEIHKSAEILGEFGDYW